MSKELTVRDVMEFLIAEAKKKGGMVSAGTLQLGTRIRAGESIALVRLGANNKGEAIMPPIAIGSDIGFGEYLVGVFIVGTKEAAEVLAVPAS